MRPLPSAGASTHPLLATSVVCKRLPPKILNKIPSLMTNPQFPPITPSPVPPSPLRSHDLPTSARPSLKSKQPPWSYHPHATQLQPILPTMHPLVPPNTTRIIPPQTRSSHLNLKTLSNMLPNHMAHSLPTSGRTNTINLCLFFPQLLFPLFPITTARTA